MEDLVARGGRPTFSQCLDRGASVQIDFTEGRLSVKLDPSKSLLNSFVDLNNRVLDRFTPEGEEAHRRPHLPRRRPRLDPQRRRGLRRAPPGALPDERRQLLHPARKRERIACASSRSSENTRTATAGIFVGVTDPINPRVETAAVVRDRILEAARFIPPSHLGTTDDCGFSPFGDDTSTSRDTAFAKISARVKGTEMASKALGV